MEKCKCAAKLVTPERMEHNNFNTQMDIVVNIKIFLTNLFQSEGVVDNEANTNEIEYISRQIYFPTFMFLNPKVY